MSRNVPSVPANALTPSYTSVASSNGFSAGDLVYYKDSNFGVIPANAVSTASFNVTATVPLGATYGSNTVKQAFGGNSTIATFGTGGNWGRSPTAAKLTNGNIVIVCGEVGATVTNVRGLWTIIDENNNTIATGVLNSGSSIYAGGAGVVALAGGGFAVVYLSTGQTIKYQIYDNSGVSVLGPTTDGMITDVNQFYIAALTGGGFAITANSGNTSNVAQRAYSSTGTQLTASNVATYFSDDPAIIIPVTSGNYVVMYRTSANIISIWQYNSTGGSVNNNTVAGNVLNSPRTQYTATLRQDGNVDFLYTSTASSWWVVRTYNPASNTFGSTVSLASATWVFGSAQTLSDGSWVWVSGNNTSGCATMYKYSANSVSLTDTINLQGFMGDWNNSTARSYSNVTVVETANYIWVFQNYSGYSNVPSAVLPYARLPKTAPFNLVGYSNTTAVVASTTASVNGYARGVSTPNAASFLAATTQTINITTVPTNGSNYVLTPYTAATDSCIWQSSTVMPNGESVIAFSSSSTVKFMVFNIAGTLLATYLVSSISVQAKVKAITLGNGKLVIAWSNANSIFFKIYSSTYTELFSGNVGTAVGGSFTDCNLMSNAAGFDVCAARPDTFIFFFNWANEPYVTEFNDTGSIVWQQNVYPGTPPRDCTIACANPNYFFVKFWSQPYSTSYIIPFVRPAGSSGWTLQLRTSTPNGNGTNFQPNAVATPTGTPVFFNSNTSSFRLTRHDFYAITNVQNPIGYQSYTPAGLCLGPQGNPVMFVCFNSGIFWAAYSGTNNSSAGTDSFVSGNLNISDYNASSNYGAVPQIHNVYGEVYMISYITTSGTLKVGLISASNATYTLNLVGGVTASNTALTPSPANGYYLAGVSASDCAPGGTGIIQTNGAATLNSQYPAGTTSQAFDFTSPILNTGVRGTIAGRNMIIEGS